MSMEEFLEALKLHYNDQQAIKLLNEMLMRSQNDEFALEKKETELELYCMRIYGYKKLISILSKEEGQPID